MAGLTEESKEAVTIIDESYEFSAPHFFDFVKGESEEDMHKAELWFETALSYAPSRKLSTLLLSFSLVFLLFSSVVVLNHPASESRNFNLISTRF